MTTLSHSTTIYQSLIDQGELNEKVLAWLYLGEFQKAREEVEGALFLAEELEAHLAEYLLTIKKNYSLLLLEEEVRGRWGPLLETDGPLENFVG